MPALTERLAFLVEMNADQAIRTMNKVGATAERELEKGVEDRLDRASKSMTRFGAVMLGSAGIASRGLYGLGSAAAEQNAALAANTQVLGENAAAVQAWAETSVEAAGLSETAAVTAATSFAAIGKTASLAGEDLTSFATSQVELAADLAAFKDVTPTQAIGDLEAAYAGSLETLRKYNIQINEQALKQAYARETGEEVTGTLTAQQRVIAVHSEVVRQSADMAGQWARESDELLGQQVRLSAQLDNLKADIGQGVLPVMTDLVGAAGDAAGAFGDLPGPVQEGAGKFLTYATAAAGVTGALSLAGGQALKMRDNLTTLGDDGTRSLNKAGRAARGAGIAFGALAAVEIASVAFDALTGRAENAARALNEATAAADQGVSLEWADQVIAAADEAEGLWTRALDTIGDGLGALGSGNEYDQPIDMTSSVIELEGATIQAGKLREVLRDIGDGDFGIRQDAIDSMRLYADTLEGGSIEQRALNSAIDEAQSDLDAAAGAADAMASSTDNLADSADDATDSIESTTTALERLTDQLRTVIGAEDAALGLADAFDDVRDAAAEAAAAAPVGGEEAEDAARGYRQAVLDLQGQILDYTDEIGGIPEEALTEIITALNEDDIAAAEARIEQLTRSRTIAIQLGPASSGPNSPAAVTPLSNGLDGERADGGPVRARGRYLVGERGPEILEMGSQSGNVVPNHELGGTVINIGTVINRDRAFDAGIHRARVQAGA